MGGVNAESSQMRHDLLFVLRCQKRAHQDEIRNFLNERRECRLGRANNHQPAPHAARQHLFENQRLCTRLARWQARKGGSDNMRRGGVARPPLLTGVSLNVASAMGLILLVGLVVKNGIVLLDYAHRLNAEGHPFTEALEIAGAVRLRPILMTTLCTLFGLLPLALGFGAGAELQRPLALAVIGGLALSTFVYVVPRAVGLSRATARLACHTRRTGRSRWRYPASRSHAATRTPRRNPPRRSPG